MQRCYLCGRILSEHLVNANECQCHDEHIIPNAIGGHLTDRHILCKDCGLGLSKDSDVGFTNIFAPFIVQMQEAGILRPLDRNDKSKRLLGGFIFANKSTDSPKEEIKYNNGKAIPAIPYYYIDEDKKVVNFCAERKTAENFVLKIKGDFKKDGKNPDDYEYKIHSDLISEGFLGLNFSHGKPKFNDDFKSGLLKIAVEMALHFGLSREQLSSALKINQKTGEANYKNEVPIIPFVPLSLPDIIFENERYKLDPNFPSHAVNVFSEQTKDVGIKNLWCYIELFSTFQYYVLLSNSYTGPDIDETYAQKLKPNYVPSVEYLTSLDPSDLSVEINGAGLSEEETKGHTYEEIAKLIHEKYRTQSSEFDLYSSLASAYSYISLQTLYLSLGTELIKRCITLHPTSISICQNLIKEEGLTFSDIGTINVKSIDKTFLGK